MGLLDRVHARMASLMANADIGMTVDVLKYTTTATASPYRQRERQYDDPVPVEGVVTRELSKEQRDSFGTTDEVDGMITFLRPSLESAFPGVPLEEAISVSDELGFDGRRWRIVRTQATGRLSAYPDVLVIGYASIKGKEDEAYP